VADAQLIARVLAFQTGDAAGMNACCPRQMEFPDPVFPVLRGKAARVRDKFAASP